MAPMFDPIQIFGRLIGFVMPALGALAVIVCIMNLRASRHVIWLALGFMGLTVSGLANRLFVLTLNRGGTGVTTEMIQAVFGATALGSAVSMGLIVLGLHLVLRDVVRRMNEGKARFGSLE